MSNVQGPLHGVKVIEMAGIGPAPFCAMLLADLGAEVLRIDRTQDSGLGTPMPSEFNVLNRGRHSAAIDLKHPQGVATMLELIGKADLLLEGFRPGVMERLGLGPDICHQKNPGLIYGRMTGWGQDGPYAKKVGHDINYIGLSGVLSCIGEAGGAPVPPLNLVADFGGGALFMAVGLISALYERRASGKGQVVDTSMVEGSAYLMSSVYGLFASGALGLQRGSNILDGGAHFYNTYCTKDGKYVAVGAIEKKFYENLLERLELSQDSLPDQFDRAQWPSMTQRFAAIFATRTRDEWIAWMGEHEVCVTPVLDLAEAPQHPHNQARQSFHQTESGYLRPAPAPRFSRTQGHATQMPPERGANTLQALQTWGISADTLQQLQNDHVIQQVS